jgi:hypothetical protein
LLIRKPLSPRCQGAPQLARRNKQRQNGEAHAYAGLSFYSDPMRGESTRSSGCAFACAQPTQPAQPQGRREADDEQHAH